MQDIVNTLFIKKMYSEPEIFEPIKFTNGINLIVGERTLGNDKQSQKTNSVGKSLFCDFLRYALLKRYSDTRISYIPAKDINLSSYVCVDFSIGKENLTIKRSLINDKDIKFFINDKISELDNTNIKKYLETLIFNNDKTLIKPSFRDLIGSIMREESSNFKDILTFFDTTNKSIPRNYEVLLYMLGINLNLYNEVNSLKLCINDLENEIKKHKKVLEQSFGKTFEEIKSEISNRRKELKKLEKALEVYSTDELFITIENEITEKENILDKLRLERNELQYEISAIEEIPEIERVDEEDIKATYNLYKEGLGDLISKSFEQTIAFKRKIEKFQNDLVEIELKKLKTNLEKIQFQINNISNNLKSLYSTLDNKGALKDLRTSLKIFEKKKEQLMTAENTYSTYEEEESKKDSFNLELDKNKIKLKDDLKDKKTNIESFLYTIIDIHEAIMGSRDNCSFDIFLKNEKSSSKEVLDTSYRIKDDGGCSVDREKVFIFDIALMFNDITSKKHPKFLLHDNILEVDQHTIIESLNYLYKESLNKNFQYILTINKDKLDIEKELFCFDIDKQIRKSYTKSSRFLKKAYQEKEK